MKKTVLNFKIMAALQLVFFIISFGAVQRMMAHSSANNVDMTWASAYSFANHYVSLSSIQQTSDGGYIGVGYISPNGEEQIVYIWVVKLDSAGEIIWQRQIGRGLSQLYDEGFVVRELPDGDFALLGSSQFPDGPTWRLNLWLGRISSDGEMLWQKRIGDNSLYFSPASMIVTNDGSIAVLAERIVVGVAWADFWLAKLDGDGQILWERIYGGGDVEYPSDLLETATGEYLITGSSVSFSSNLWGDAWLLKLDRDGEIIWQKKFGGERFEKGYHILPASEGGYLLAGVTASYVIYPDYGHVWLIKLDTDGAITWQKTYRISPGAGEPVIGYMAATDSYVISTRTDTAESWTFAVDTNGNIMWQKFFDFPGGIGDLQPTDDGGIIMAGPSINVDWDLYGWLVTKASATGDVSDCAEIVEVEDGISIVTNDEGIDTASFSLVTDTPVSDEAYPVIATFATRNQWCPVIPEMTPTPTLAPTVTPTMTPTPMFTPDHWDYLPAIVR